MKTPKKERNLKFKDGRWFIDFRFKGKRLREFGGYTKEAARNYLAKLRMDMLDEARGFKRPSQDIPFAKFADDFLEDYCKQNKRSWQRDEFSLNSLKDFFKGETLQSIGPEKIERYKAKRKSEVSPATVNRELACLKTLFNKSVEWGKVEINPAAKIKKFREDNARERILSPEEARRLLESSSPGLRPVLIVALKTGLRRNEILGLKWKDVNFIKKFILIEHSKSGKSRKVPMSSAVHEGLKTLPRLSEFIFYNPETKTHFKNLSAALATACKNAGIKAGFRFHDCRHTFATWYMENGGDIVALSKILGHSTLQMTLRYCNPTEESMLRAVEKMDKILDPKGQKADNLNERAVAVEPVTYSHLSN